MSGGGHWRSEKPDLGRVFHVDAEVIKDNDRTLGEEKDGEPHAKVSSDYRGVARRWVDNLRAFTRGWKSVVQERHGDMIMKCVDGASRPRRPGRGRGGVQGGGQPRSAGYYGRCQ